LALDFVLVFALDFFLVAIKNSFRLKISGMSQRPNILMYFIPYTYFVKKILSKNEALAACAPARHVRRAER